MAVAMSSPPSIPQYNPPADTAGLPPITTDKTVEQPQSSLPCSKDRLSTYSDTSYTSQNYNRPESHAFPIFHSSLSYALVRDFAYPSVHPLHYGPPPAPSGASTPVSEQRRLSDPPATWDASRGHWSTGSWSNDNNSFGHQHLPAMSFGDGPPYSEDEDLHSPVVTTRHRKYKSTGTDLDGQGDRSQGDLSQGADYFSDEDTRGSFISMNADGSETYYVDDEEAAENGPGGEFVTYPADQGRYSMYGAYGGGGGGDQEYNGEPGLDSDDDWCRYSRDYQFAVGCPDEEMHGRAVALFDFTREHENELPLTEGQVIYVSYRQSQGWLVAEDPKTGESGLVPEEFVRLLRDIEGGLNSLNGAEPTSTSTESSGNIAAASVGSESSTTDSDQTATPTKRTTDSQDQQPPLSSSSETQHQHQHQQHSPPSTKHPPDPNSQSDKHGNGIETGTGTGTETNGNHAAPPPPPTSGDSQDTKQPNTNTNTETNS